MLRELITWVLNTYLGKYLEDFNPAQLTVALLSGEVELENVPLRKDALRGLGLPLQILYGNIGKIKLQVPIRQFRTAPWCIVIEKISLIIGPKNLKEWNLEKEKQYELDYKLLQLDDLEVKWRAQKETNFDSGSNSNSSTYNHYATSYSGWLNYGSGLIANIVENLQLKINDVHIRYEDSLTTDTCSFACGIKIVSLSAQSCDSNWIPGFTSARNQSMESYKLLELCLFSFYWDRNDNEVFVIGTDVGESSFSSHSNFKKEQSDKDHHFIIKPITAQAYLKRDRSEIPLRTRKRPRLSCEVIVDEIHLSLSDFQYTQMIECIRKLDIITKRHKCRLLRPHSSVKENPLLWWKYAAKCHGFNFETYEQKLRKALRNINYFRICAKLIQNPNENLTLEEKQFKFEFEMEHDLSELKLLREICFTQTDKSTVKLKEKHAVVTNQGRSMLFHWFPQWWGWYGGNNSNGGGFGSNIGSTSLSSTPSLDSVINENETTLEDELLVALEDSVENSNSLLKRDVVFGKFDFLLKRGLLDVCTELQTLSSSTTKNVITIMLQMHFDELKLNIETRPRSGSHLIGLSLGSICVKDLITKDTEFPNLIKPQIKEEIKYSIGNASSIYHKKAKITKETGSVQNSAINDTSFVEPWFQLQYEKKPLTYNTDFRFAIKTRSLDVVYNVGPFKWLIDFIIKPILADTAKQKLAAMKYTTKIKLIKNWKNILDGDLGQRKSWSLEIDVSAPQILFIKDFSSKNTSIVLVDFGRFQLLKNAAQSCRRQQKESKRNLKPIITVPITTSAEEMTTLTSSLIMLTERDSEDEDAFMTPCSTPPGSEKSISESPTMCNTLNDLPTVDDTSNIIINKDTRLENAFQDKIYDKYTIDLTDLQVIVCKSKERWGWANSKGTSALHVLDRFNISLHLQRRIIHTIDPEYPSLTLYGTLPKLVAHVNESKIAAITDIIDIVSMHDGFKASSHSKEATSNTDNISKMEQKTLNIENIVENDNKKYQNTNNEDNSPNREQQLIFLQFVIDQMSLELQSRGRSIAELQVSGVKASLTKSQFEMKAFLSVHGLLLGDAIQSFGPDFELLVASHRHVGMDSVSGSLKQSEPCSPLSPTSPDLMLDISPTSPKTTFGALNSLQRDALITVEINLINADERLQIVNIHFNNLDIIANQETIVELLGFLNRVFPSTIKQQNYCEPSAYATTEEQKKTTPTESSSKINDDYKRGISETENIKIRTEITFDFNRLNVLVLRALMRDSCLVGRKVGTFTMCEAKIHATVDSDCISVEGSLGGLQILDLTPEGVNHQRILSVGRDPLTELPDLECESNRDLLSTLSQKIYGSSTLALAASTTKKDKLNNVCEYQKALTFHISRNIQALVSIKIRMASVWYTHCARFVQELSWCITEFKHYLKNIVKSIREKATDMAFGLVQPVNDIQENISSYASQEAKKPSKSDVLFKHKKKGSIKTLIKIDIILDTPVLVMPRSSCSSQVLVAHLGKISVMNFQNKQYILQSPSSQEHTLIDEYEIFSIDEENSQQKQNFISAASEINEFTSNNCDNYSVDVRNMNLFSLDTSRRKEFRLSALPRTEEFYSCQCDAVAILHDTAIRLDITKFVNKFDVTTAQDDNTLHIHGVVTQPLQISLTRSQYEQLLDTIDSIFKVPNELVRPPTEVLSTSHISDIMINNENSASPFNLMKNTLTINLDPKNRGGNSKPSVEQQNKKYKNQSTIEPKVSFTLPVFIIQLKNEHNNPHIEITFREFSFNYEKNNCYETHIQISLRSILMEDLLCPIDSKYRQMVVSLSKNSSDNSYRSAGVNSCSSNSCPDLIYLQSHKDIISGSLPENLESIAGFENTSPSQDIFCTKNVQPSRLQLHTLLCPDTPPPSPQPKIREDNLVIYSLIIIDSDCPNLDMQHKGSRQTSSIDFNSLDLLVSVERWYLFLNFFGLVTEGDVDSYQKKDMNQEETIIREQTNEDSKLEITVRSLTLVLVRNESELAKVNVSNAFLVIAKRDISKVIEGRLGSVSLLDLTPYGEYYREKFLTSGSEALNFMYKSDNEKNNQRTLNKDAKLKIQMSSVKYVHTKRFIMEIQMFVKEFLQLQTPVIRKIKSSSDIKYNLKQRPTQLGLEIKADSPIIVLPLSYNSNQVIVIDLGEFTLENSFHLASEQSIISKKSDPSLLDEILDVMQVNLLNMNFLTGTRYSKFSEITATHSCKSLEMIHCDICLDMGNYWIKKVGKNLLKEKCHLNLQIERNMDSSKSHNCPDFSVQGTLIKLDAMLDIEQYKLIRGFLSYNLGERIDDIYNRNSFSLAESRVNLNTNEFEKLPDKLIWNTMSINLDLENVSLILNWSIQNDIDDNTYPLSSNIIQSNQSLACINFIKSCLKIDSFSDGSQDIDLVSQEILINDSRYHSNCSSTPQNVFTNILQPIHDRNNSNLVQAEVHSRQRNDCSKFTILLNNMRLMAIIDWIENIQDYLSQISQPPLAGDTTSVLNSHANAELSSSATMLVFSDHLIPMEVILNITDSELIFVEKTHQFDTNAIILKSTTVVSFKQADIIKPVSINLNNLEVFSCVLGSEDETALSIIDPITINLDVKNHTLEIQIQKQFCIRLSYHDVIMFTRMFHSLPKQTRTAKKSIKEQSLRFTSSAVKSLTALGFQLSDCIKALKICNNQLDEAALWLTQNREPVGCLMTADSNVKQSNKILDVNAIVVCAQCISICIIDDCKDADVPLLELNLSQLDFKQEFNKNIFSSSQVTTNYNSTGLTRFNTGYLKALIASNYYNRNLSGWEPIIEPWECLLNWNYSIAKMGNERSCLNLSISSDKLLNLNITNTLVELWKMVQTNWTQDYYGASNIYDNNTKAQSPIGYRHRVPFIPFALKNNTGEDLKFKILLTKPGGITTTEIPRGNMGSQWIRVKSNETMPFSFGEQSKFRHLDSHKLNLHQILVHVDGWTQVGPISVDRVGIFFRIANRENTKFPNIPKTRIVFTVTLEGSAQKLVTVRSALRLVNRLENVLLLKMEYPTNYFGISNWPDAQTIIIGSGETFNISLTHSDSYLSFKPLPSLITSTDVKNARSNNQNRGEGDQSTASVEKYYQFCDKPFHWRESLNQSGNEIYQEQRTCKSIRNELYNVIVSIRKDGYPHKEGGPLMPGHTIVLMPPLRINNLLCCDLLYKLGTPNIFGRIQSSETAKVYNVNINEPVTLCISLDGYKVSGQLTIPIGHYGIAEPKLRLTDIRKRDLYLRASIQSIKGSGMEISISAPFWLVNKTGLPLVFRQEGVPHEASGQFEEHEKARVVSPLMFSFSDPDASPALEIRLGNRFGPNPPWCQSLSLHKEVIHRQLRSGYSNETFVIGLEIRRGRGRYSRTSVVTFSPRFQLYNRSSHKLQFIQKCFVVKPLDPEAKATIIDAVPGCHFPFNWSRSDHEPLLCIRLPDVEGSFWSSGIPINEVQSLYINIRNERGEMRFLRLEVVLQGATYFLLFGNANTLPPPIRIDNHSDVSIKFFQYECTPEWRTIVKPHSTVSYALDNPIGRQCLQIEAPDGDSFICNLRELNVSHTLTYSNFIYIAFKRTFQHPSIPENLLMSSESDVESQHLVLGVKDKRVVLMKKCAGDRSQLWLMNPMQQLEHEGSSAPIDPRRKSVQCCPRLVLDLEKAPNPTDLISLVIRPANKQRESTQTWKFFNGRLMCGHANMCVQARNGVFGLRPGCDVVLGRINSVTHMESDSLVPVEQQIERQKLRPGSGQLEVQLKMDGPIKTIQIRDVNSSNDIPLAPDPQWKHASNVIMSSLQEGHNFVGNKQTGIVDEYYIKINLFGLGISIISKYPCEELLYMTLQKIVVEAVATPFVQSIDLNICHMQIDNQLLETPCPILLYMPKEKNNNALSDSFPSSSSAIAFNSKMLPTPNTNAVIFQCVYLTLPSFVLYLEERLILKMAIFFELGASQQHATSLVGESEYEAQQVTMKILAANAKRYYFENLYISSCQIRLSVITASKLSPQLNVAKRKLGLTLVRFEDALIDFDQFTDKHHFESLEIYWRAIKSHYKKQLKWHFGQILGSLDVFGNPLGLASDVTEGVSGFIFEGSVKSLVANVTHGFSNTAAKITETLSDSLGKVVLDEQDTEARQKILEVTAIGPSSSKEHLAAALKGLGFGVLGGFTSIAKHTYQGTQSDGFQGFISGLTKGLVGTVTKPIIGLLDFASESANALRETSRSPHRILPDRIRLPRCVTGAPGGLLPLYSCTHARGQHFLYITNKRDFFEQLMSYEPNLYEDQNSRFRLLISTEYVRILSRTDNDENSTILSFHLKEVLSCHPVTVNKTQDNHKLKKPIHYIEISSNSPNQLKRPRVRCQTEEMAEKASRYINYAKSVFEERENTLSYDNSLLDIGWSE